jgi:phosphoadenosine phosphosulfate reductase
MPPQLVLAWAAQTFGDALAVVTSFQKTGVVTLQMLRDVAPNVTVLTLDTGNLFPETIAYIDQLQADWNLNVVRVHPPAKIPADMWQYNVDACCELRKVEPLNVALQGGFRAWVAGVRRDQSAGRMNVPVAKYDHRGLVKLAPFANWTGEMIDDYITAHDLPVNPLYAQGYTSIGCAPCTQLVNGDEDERAGRWRGTAKTECGIHLPAT